MDASAWVGAAGAVVALIALYFTHQQVKQARDQTALQQEVRRDAAQPYVWADIRPDRGNGYVFELVLRNEGPTVATQVRVAFDHPLPNDFGGPDPAPKSLYALASMPPGRELRWFLKGGPEWFESATLPRAFEVAIDCHGPYGPVPTLRYTLDINDFDDVQSPGIGSLKTVANAIEGLAKVVAKKS
ncbi:MAG: hypothetical protein JWN77_2492 [Frankiales bacterium]|jgi:hypothetical protein|nr:hypothetical protein [Frankiales bacterium]